MRRVHVNNHQTVFVFSKNVHARKLRDREAEWWYFGRLLRAHRPVMARLPSRGRSPERLPNRRARRTRSHAGASTPGRIPGRASSGSASRRDRRGECRPMRNFNSLSNNAMDYADRPGIAPRASQDARWRQRRPGPLSGLARTPENVRERARHGRRDEQRAPDVLSVTLRPLTNQYCISGWLRLKVGSPIQPFNAMPSTSRSR